ncbi:hypothetical protein D3C80_1254340 [compost metagenome]
MTCAGNPFDSDVPRSNRRTEIGAFSYRRAVGDGLAIGAAIPMHSIQGSPAPAVRPRIANPANRRIVRQRAADHRSPEGLRFRALERSAHRRTAKNRTRGPSALAGEPRFGTPRW